MRKVAKALGLMILLPYTATWVDAHQATEQYIPLGHSPGISNKFTHIGEIVAVDAQDRTITVAKQAGTQTVSITDDTKIWLDRSMLKRSNQQGSFADLQMGRKVEVKYVDRQSKESAEWVKIQILAP